MQKISKILLRASGTCIIIVVFCIDTDMKKCGSKAIVKSVSNTQASGEKDTCSKERLQ